MSGNDEEVFEIVDFTSASEWEVFTSKVEEILLAWNLSVKDKEDVYSPGNISGDWKSSSEDISFAGYPFIVTHHWAENTDEVNNLNSCSDRKGNQVVACLEENWKDFPVNCHPLGSYYGLSEFVIISPAGNEALSTESRINLVLSSITMSVSNIQCRLPVFVQIHSKSQQLYLGIYESKNFRTDFEMVHLSRIPPPCNYLTGLLDLFKEKIGNSCQERVDVSVCWTYSLSNISDLDVENWPQAPPDFAELDGAAAGCKLGQLAFGTTKDPIKRVKVAAIWASLNEDVVVDSEVYTDLDPLQAPLWTIHLELNDNVPSLMVKNLLSYLDTCRSTDSTEKILGKNYTVLQSPDSPEYESALGALTKANVYPSLVSSKASSIFGSKTTTTAKRGGPIPENVIITLLNFLFPDAEKDQSLNPYSTELLEDLPANLDASWKDCLAGFKTSPVGSLVWRLATVMVYTNTHLKSVEGVAHLWHEIVLELRYRWENGYTIPGLKAGLPDLNYCLLYQKLQMLNCCIGHRNARLAPSKEVETAPGEDEFFDAEEEISGTSHSAWNQPQGRKEKTNMKLLKTAETLYVPVTQESLPMTEDMVEEHAEMLTQLGSDAEGSQLRARILSASLYSDMEAFKAANPGAEMEDFVRWHSPRDWIEEEIMTSEGRRIEGGLSPRMQAAGNLWQEMWQACKPVSAMRQRRLFDDTKEAEKILHTFSAMKPSQIAGLLLPTVLHAAIYRLLQDDVPQLPDVARNCRQLIAKSLHAVRHTPRHLDTYQDILPLLKQGEVRVSQYKSLQTKFQNYQWDGVDQFVTELLISRHVPLQGGAHTPAGSVLLKTISKNQQQQQQQQQEEEEEEEKEEEEEMSDNKLPAPYKKEFIVKTKASRPAAGSMASCQRMYASIESGSFRLAGAFSQDTLFY